MISVVVPLYNDEKNIRRCLESLEKELLSGDEVAVVDNGSTDSSSDIVKEFERIKLLVLKSGNIGAVRNYGAKHTSGDILAFIDSDCVVLPGWRSALLSSLHENDSIAATGAKCRVPGKSPWFVTVWFSQRRENGDVPYINSGNFIVKRSIFENIGGFDEAIVTGEDAEICLRLKQAGYRVVEDSQIAVTHYGNPENIVAFYRQQKWHGLGMFGTFRVNKFDKPLIMTIVFGVIVSCAIFFLFSQGLSPVNILMTLSLLSVVPMAAGLYRCYNMRSWKELPGLFFLYSVYFIARLHALFLLIGKREWNRTVA